MPTARITDLAEALRRRTAVTQQQLRSEARGIRHNEAAQMGKEQAGVLKMSGNSRAN